MNLRSTAENRRKSPHINIYGLNRRYMALRRKGDAGDAIFWDEKSKKIAFFGFFFIFGIGLLPPTQTVFSEKVLHPLFGHSMPLYQRIYSLIASLDIFATV